jgi:predicted DNA-binding protein
MTIKRVTVQLPESLHKQLKYLSVTEDTTMQKIILESIKLYLSNLNTYPRTPL